MEHVLSPIATIGALFFIACLSPGPDFINITSYSLASRRAGLAAAAGAVLGVFLLASAIATGLSMAASWFNSLYIVLRVVGAGYLAYLGYRAILGALRSAEPPMQAAKAVPSRVIFWRGIATNLANPKAAFFIASIFTTMLPANTPAIVYLISILVVTIVGSFVYAGIAFTFSLAKIQTLYRRAWRVIDGFLGLCFVGLAAKLALQK